MNKAILVTSFGTSHPDTREKTIGAIQNIVSEKYGKDKVERAYTSNVVRRIVERQEGIKIFNHQEGIEELQKRGYDDIITMSLHIIEGFEYKNKINRNGLETKVTKPLLYIDEDYKKVVNDKDINDFTGYDALIFMGHGSEDVADKTYIKLQDIYKQEGKKDIYIGTVEGERTLEDIIEEIKNKNYKKILLKPFMIVAGDHAKNDMASDEEDSWNTILTELGYIVNSDLRGLGEYSLIREMFMKKLEDVIN